MYYINVESFAIQDYRGHSTPYPSLGETLGEDCVGKGDKVSGWMGEEYWAEGMGCQCMSGWMGVECMKEPADSMCGWVWCGARWEYT